MGLRIDLAPLVLWQGRDGCTCQTEPSAKENAGQLPMAIFEDFAWRGNGQTV
jgi:hypothetical protein